LLSQVDSEDALGNEDTSSSLVTVEADEAEAPRSGEDMLEVSTDWTGCAGVDEDICGWVSRAVVGCSVADSDSASSAQLGAGPVEPFTVVEVVSLAGVAAPDAGLLCVTGVDMPFAACAYEKVDAAMVLCEDVFKQKKRFW
jgi:hypothetical protein